jgi:hypothetical protein
MEMPEECRDVLDALVALTGRLEELLTQGAWAPSQALCEAYDAMVESIPPNQFTREVVQRPLAWWTTVADETGDAVIARRLRALQDAWILALRRLKLDQDVPI